MNFQVIFQMFFDWFLAGDVPVKFLRKHGTFFERIPSTFSSAPFSAFLVVSFLFFVFLHSGAVKRSPNKTVRVEETNLIAQLTESHIVCYALD